MSNLRALQIRLAASLRRRGLGCLLTIASCTILRPTQAPPVLWPTEATRQNRYRYTCISRLSVRGTEAVCQHADKRSIGGLFLGPPTAAMLGGPILLAARCHQTEANEVEAMSFTVLQPGSHCCTLLRRLQRWSMLRRKSLRRQQAVLSALAPALGRNIRLWQTVRLRQKLRCVLQLVALQRDLLPCSHKCPIP